MKILGLVIEKFAMALSLFFNFLINVIELIVILASSIRQLFFLIFFISCGSIFFFPVFLFSIRRDVLGLIFVIMFIPLLGRTTVSFLRYVNYVTVEWLMDRAGYFISGGKRKKQKFGKFSEEYWQFEEKRRRWQRQQDDFNRKFREAFGGFEFEFGGFDQTNGYNYDQYQTYYADSAGDFKRKYEESCDILQVAHNADKYQIKLQYKKLAKKYHPDLNKQDGATEKFLEIQKAYEFLNDENIRKYKNL